MTNGASRTRVFVGSSAEGLRVAQAVQVLLDRSCDVEIWSQGVFSLTEGTLESLLKALDTFDFAILIATADDITVSRGSERPAPRDNVLFELGLFMGALGRERTVVVHDRNAPPSFPSDLHGIQMATYEIHQTGNLQASLGAPCTEILERIERLGVRETRQASRLGAAAHNVQNVSSQMESLIKLLARSRKVELDIISKQFGTLMPANSLQEINNDLDALSELLDASNEHNSP